MHKFQASSLPGGRWGSGPPPSPFGLMWRDGSLLRVGLQLVEAKGTGDAFHPGSKTIQIRTLKVIKRF